MTHGGLMAPGYDPFSAYYTTCARAGGASSYIRTYYLCHTYMDQPSCWILDGFGSAARSKVIGFYFPATPCRPGQKFEGPAPGVCKDTAPPCPVKLTEDYKNDACAVSLEAGKGQDVYNQCPPAPIMEDAGGWKCLVRKATGLGVSAGRLNAPGGSIRSPAYQKHFIEIWEKWKELLELEQKSPDKFAACVANGVYAKIEYEKNQWHGIAYAPGTDPHKNSHSDGTAVDVDEGIVDDMQDNLSVLTCPATSCWLDPTCTPGSCQDLQDYLDDNTFNGPSCNLNWGGLFQKYDKYDPVHFQLR